MSNAKKCNRCGTCFDPLEVDGYFTRFQNPVYQNADDARKGVCSFRLLNDKPPDEIVDLCPECAEDFETFMCVPSHTDIPRTQKSKEKKLTNEVHT